ncbi:unnamed protein product [Linum trigynum]|uniref:S-protein homolog n=1 Tax=Linum trigynum TaxID=586398 RepID=A0AAV2D1Z1_9ROSI
MWRLLIPSKSRVAVLAAAFIILIAAHPSTQLSTSTVYVENELSGNKKLIVHCRSKDDDVGAQAVDIGAALHWGFTPYEGTLFWCKLAVEDRRLSFDAYNGKKADIRCRDVRWAARDDGVHLLNSDGTEIESYRKEWKHLF